MSSDIDCIHGSELFREEELIFINRNTEDERTELHSHDYIEISYVASGKGLHLLGDKDYSVTKGDLFIINPGTPHKFLSLPDYKDNNLIIYNCVFRPEFIDIILTDSYCFSDLANIFLFNSLFESTPVGNEINLFNKPDCGIGDLFDKMHYEFISQDFGYIEILRSYLIELIIKIFRLYRYENFKNESLNKLYFDKIIKYINENYKEPLKLEDLAAISFLSRNYFCKRFKENTGMTVVEYIQHLRIDEACNLLNNNELKIIDISTSIGYKDIKFFTKLFKKYIGMTPRDYRKLYSVKREKGRGKIASGR